MHFLPKSIVLLFTTLLLFSCASITGFEVARTVPKDQGQIRLSANASQSLISIGMTMENLRNFFFPNLEVVGRLGLSEQIDVGVKVNSNLNFILDGKFQFVGDHHSKFAMAAGLGVGNVFLISPLWYFQVPLYLSVHPSEKVAFYINPKYTYQFQTSLNDDNLDLDNIRYTGGNIGVLFGDEIQFGLDFGYYNTSWAEQDRLITGGLGVVFEF